jgi:hypothetical protein
MNNEEILEEIAYLDADIDEKSVVTSFSSGEMIALVRDAIQIEIAKQGHLRKAEDVSARIASLEKRVEAMRREFMRQRGTPSVTYVRRQDVVVSPNVIVAPTTTTEARRPTAMVVFYGLGLACSLVFAILLALSAVKVNTIHPFISLLGLVGGLGWLTTAWTDLLLWNREKPIGNRAKKTEDSRAVPA